MTPVASPSDHLAESAQGDGVVEGGAPIAEHGAVTVASAARTLSPPLVDERAARAELRRQIGRLEHTLGQAVFEGPVVAEAARIPAGAGSPTTVVAPRMLSLGELERLRDDLVARLDAVRAAAAAEGERHALARGLLEAMLADPPAHPWVRVRNEDLGLPGCTTYQVRPRLGPIGMLMDWWQVKVSSGCPLARRQPAHP
jgi:hypothetical protein